MKKLLKISVLLLAMGLIFGLIGCGDLVNDNNNQNNNQGGSNQGGNDQGGNDQGGNNQGGNNENDGINWANEPAGTLTVINNVSKDMVIFVGQTPQASNILGGVRGLSTKTFDISDDVDDFNIGGFIILRGMTKDEYEANKTNLSSAKVDYSAMATYGQGKKFRTEISPNYTGDYAYRVTNLGRIGMELRKDSPDGEKIGYLPSLASRMLLYSDNTDGFAIYPVFVYYQRSTGQVTTLKPTSQFETIGVSPRPAANSTQIQSYTLPADQGATWDSIKATLSSPVAYVTVTNNVTNQSGRVTISGTNWLYSQNGYDSIGSGETLTYEISSTNAGTQQALTLAYYNQSVLVPVLMNNATPVLKNGYDYTVTVSGSGQTAAGYTVTITESANARDLSSDIESL